MASAAKKRKIDAEVQPKGGKSVDQHIKLLSATATVHNAPPSGQNSALPLTHIDRVDLKVQEAKRFAVWQAHQEGCTGIYKSFDSYFGNYLIPVIPTLSDLEA